LKSSEAAVEVKPYAGYGLGLLRLGESLPAMVRAAKAENPRLQRAATDGLATCMELRGNPLSCDAGSGILAELIQIMKSDPDRTSRSGAASSLDDSADRMAVRTD